MEIDPPGWPGIEPRWTSSAKSAIGTARSGSSTVWFALSHGIVDEVYYPSLDIANTRDFGFLVSDGQRYFSEEKRDCQSMISSLVPGVPAFLLENRAFDGRYAITKTIFTHPELNVLFQRVEFHPLQGSNDDYRLYALLAPHVGNRGRANDGWSGDYKGVPMLFAQRDATCMALACTTPFLGTSCGYVGVSDGWQDISANKRLTWRYPRARDGNIALTGEIDLAGSDEAFVLALAFGDSPAEAGQLARRAISEDFDNLLSRYTTDWLRDQPGNVASFPGATLFDSSVIVLKTHESKRAPGGLVASLSIPWGTAKGDDELGGYHLVWPRDLVEIAGGLLAVDDFEGARRTLRFLLATQEADGHWAQNMWLDGTPFWTGIQMDETAFPILLAGQLRRVQALGGIDSWPMLRKAAAYLVVNGPVTGQDRWEEDGGYSPFTLAVEIAALLVAAEFANDAGEHAEAEYLRETADTWNANVERWTYIKDGELGTSAGVDGYYVRIGPLDLAEAACLSDGWVPIKNRPPGESSARAGAIVSPDALALVRFGLRAPDDARIVDTVKVIDAALKTETATGPVWHRYPGDGYGEHADGSPFDGTGIGRGWPLLAGERGHYELAVGNRPEAQSLLRAMERQANDGGLIPEQVWDTADIPSLFLFSGRPSGSAMPLAWAHAEYLKLARSLQDGAVFDRPPETAQRYLVDGVTSNRIIWRFNNKCRALPAGATLRIEAPKAAAVVWTTDGWQTTQTTELRDSGLGIHFADWPTAGLPAGAVVQFTFRWDSGDWEGSNYEVGVVAPALN